MRVYTLALSILAHLVAVIPLIIVPLVATDVLPEPRRTVEFVQTMPGVIQPLPLLRSREQPTRSQVASEGAPVEAPQGVQPEVDVAPPDWFDLRQSTVDGVPLVGELVGSDPLPPPPREVEPVRVGGLVSRPERGRYVTPVYPALARGARVEGTVILEAVLGIDGLVREVRVLRSIPLLDEAALQAVRQWQFTPTLLNGEAVPVVLTVTVVFTLR